MKKLDPNDPRVTTYALGELPEAERAEFKAALEQSPEAKAEVESIREMSEMLTSDFAAELDENAPTTIEKPLPTPAPRRWKKAMVASASIAAVLAVSALVLMQQLVFVEEQKDASSFAVVLGANDQDHAMLQKKESAIPRQIELTDPIASERPRSVSGPRQKTTADAWNGAFADAESVSLEETEVLNSEAQPLAEDLIAATGRTLKRDPITVGDSLLKETNHDGLSIGLTPESAPEATFEYNSSPPNVASIDAAGAIAGDSSDELRQREGLQQDQSELAAIVPANEMIAASGISVTAGAGIDLNADQTDNLNSQLAAVPTGSMPAASEPELARNRFSRIGHGGTSVSGSAPPAAPAAVAAPPMPLSKIQQQSVATIPSGGSDDAQSSAARNTPLFRSLRSSDSRRHPGLGRVAPLVDNSFTDPLAEPLSTFSVDVDSASYTTIRRALLQENRVPHPDSVRIEEMVNYFDYPSYAKADWNVENADGEAPFSINLASATAPWDANKRIVRVGLRGAEVAATERPPLNLAFLLDVSGSMSSEDKLPLMQKALAEFVPQLRREDKVTIVVYAGSSGEVLAPTAGSDHATIREALAALSSGGSTAGASGITLAYQRARENFIEDGINQVILATDGDFNVGTSDDESLVKLVEREAKSGVFLTVLGFGSGNLNDSMLEKITNQGNGQYHYIDRIEEGRRVLVEELTGTLVPIAKDVKVQVEFNPAKVASYRLIGYANRMLEAQDFADDTVDASEIGAGHTVTALYEVLPVENLMKMTEAEKTPDLKYQKPAVDAEPPVSPFEARQRELADRGLAMTDSNEWLTVKLRYKKPKENVSVLVDRPMTLEGRSMAEAGSDLQFAIAVAAFGMNLRGNADVGTWGLANVLELAKASGNDDPARNELIRMIERAIELTGAGSTTRDVQEKLKELR